MTKPKRQVMPAEFPGPPRVVAWCPRCHLRLRAMSAREIALLVTEHNKVCQ